MESCGSQKIVAAAGFRFHHWRRIGYFTKRENLEVSKSTPGFKRSRPSNALRTGTTTGSDG